ncbi:MULTISPECIES: hypothetical protein [Streptomyces]|uniref:hypothetical protein n=1 Tax=Streptomyces TaxID=1883 RepID=UPI0005BCDEAA|nr:MULTISPECIES: hypothetical protein [Streptomyces]
MPNDALRGGPAQVAARLAATAAAPLDPASADAPQVLHWPGRRLLLQRGDTELAVRDLDGEGLEVRFPAPRPRRFGSVAVSPTGDVAEFADVHALRAVATDTGQWALYLHRAEDGMEPRRLDATKAVPHSASADDDRVRWDYEAAAFPHDGTAVVGTEYSAQDPRHRLVDPHTMYV